jgi:competence protein ComEA
VLIFFLFGIVAKEIKYDSLKIKPKKYSYEIYDSLFNSINDSNYKESIGAKKSEKRVDSEAELSDFSNNEKDFKKEVLTSAKVSYINLNDAGLEELIKVPGIGKITAERIIELRRLKGGFRNIDELLEVKRIGKKRLQKLKEYLIIKN